MNELQEAEISCSDTGHVMWYRLPELSLHPISQSHYIKEVKTTILWVSPDLGVGISQVCLSSHTSATWSLGGGGDRPVRAQLPAPFLTQD